MVEGLLCKDMKASDHAFDIRLVAVVVATAFIVHAVAAGRREIDVCEPVALEIVQKLVVEGGRGYGFGRRRCCKTSGEPAREIMMHARHRGLEAWAVG